MSTLADALHQPAGLRAWAVVQERCADRAADLARESRDPVSRASYRGQARAYAAHALDLRQRAVWAETVRARARAEQRRAGAA